MNYKTILNTPEIIKRDIAFIEYLEKEIEYHRQQYKYHNYECNKGNVDKHKILKSNHYNILLNLEMVVNEFYKITDKKNEE